MFLLCSTEPVFGMALQILNGASSIPDSANTTKSTSDSSVVVQLNDSCHMKQTTDTSSKVFRAIRVMVTPGGVSDASITIIRKGTINIQASYTAVTGITPDTLGIWTPPLSMCLSLGIYDVVAIREGYKKAVKEIEINQKQKYDIFLDMKSLEYLRNKREQWATYKWISAVIFAGSGASSFYFKNRITKYADEYHSAMSTDVIQESRNRVHTNQSNYRIFSTVAFSALGTFAFSWLIESIYN